MNSNKVDYLRHTRIWFPEDIQAGDIIACRVKTFRNNVIRYAVRNVLILGLQYSPDRKEVTALHVARFSDRRDFGGDERHRFYIGQEEYRKGNISGINVPVYLRTNHTDVIPVNEFHFPEDRAERIGSVSREYLGTLLEELRCRRALDRSKRLSCYGKIDPYQRYIPSLSYLVKGGEERPENPLIPYSKPTEKDQTEAIAALLDMSRRMDGHIVTQEYLDDLTRRRVKSLKIEEDQMPKKFRLGLTEKYSNANGAISRASNADAANTELTQNFQTGASDRSVLLPKQLWQGRYLMLNVSGLFDDESGEEARKGVSLRPCALWKIYNNAVTGEIVGMELYPVLNSKERHAYRMPVYPLRKEDGKEMVLVADSLVRVPLARKYFGENNSGPLYELTPSKIESFRNKVKVVEDQGAKVAVMGLSEVPPNWVEAPFPPSPSIEQLRKWAEQRRIFLDGNLGDVSHVKSHGRRERNFG